MILLFLCIGFLTFSLYFITIGNGFLSAIFLILSMIAFINTNGGGKDDDQKPA